MADYVVYGSHSKVAGTQNLRVSYIKFTVTTAGTIEIIAHNASFGAGNDCIIYIFNQAGQLVAAGDNYNGGRDARIFAGFQVGTYTVAISESWMSQDEARSGINPTEEAEPDVIEFTVLFSENTGVLQGEPALDYGSAPVAVDDMLAAVLNETITYTADQLIGNDQDADGDSLVLLSVSSVSGGRAVLNGDGTVTFTPNADFTGQAVFDYRVGDGTFRRDTGRATVEVSDGVNDAPTVTIDLRSNPPAGGEARVNTTTSSDQSWPSAAALSDGGYVVTWMSYDQDGEYYGIFAQRYDSSGAPAGGEVLVNTITAGDQALPSVAGLTGGGYAVAWQSGGGGNHDVHVQRFDGSGVPQGVETVVNTTTTGDQFESTIAGTANGGFVVAWTDASGGVYAQRFTSAGAPLSDELEVMAAGDASSRPSVAGVNGGGFVFVWQWEGQDGSGTGIYAWLFNEEGEPVGSPVLVNTVTAGHQSWPSVAALAGGGHVVAWRSEGQDGSGYGIYAQRFDAAGDPVGDEARVNTTTAQDQLDPSVTALSDGGFVVAWHSVGQDGSGNGVYAQRYDSAGAPVGEETRVNSHTSHNQERPALAQLNAGGFVAIWMSHEQDGADHGIYAQRFGAPVADAIEQVAHNLKNKFAISIEDPDAGSSELTVTLSVDYGVINIEPGTSGAILASGNGTGSVVISGTLAEIDALLNGDQASAVTYTPDTDTPPANSTLTVSVNDNGNEGSGGAQIGMATAPIAINAVDDAPIAQPDAVSTAENAVANGDLFADNGSGLDADADGDTFAISEVNGSSDNVGVPITLVSGAILTVNADGTYSYDPNGKFDHLTNSSSGATNISALDTFEYTVAGGNTVIVTITVNGLAGPGDQLRGNGSDNSITATPQGDMFDLSQGGDDEAQGLGGNDGFYLGNALSEFDDLDGGTGSNDQLVLQGNVTATIYGANLQNIEVISLLSGSVTQFGDTANNLYDYSTTITDAAVDAGERLKIWAAGLRAGEDLVFDGSAETDGHFTLYAGFGTDFLTGGHGNDYFFFGDGGRFTVQDRIVGNGGAQDQLGLRGDYDDAQLVFENDTITGVDTIVLISGSDPNYGLPTAGFGYNIKTHDDNVGLGEKLSVWGLKLTSSEAMTFDGSSETNGRFDIFGGAANDSLTGGAGNDMIFGALGADSLTGNGGIDTFVYRHVDESSSLLGSIDSILDFNRGDKVDLSVIDADDGTAGNQAFRFVASNAFSNTAGELRAVNGGGSDWTIEADIDGDGAADLNIIVTISDADPITAVDFVL